MLSLPGAQRQPPFMPSTTKRTAPFSLDEDKLRQALADPEAIGQSRIFRDEEAAPSSLTLGDFARELTGYAPGDALSRLLYFAHEVDAVLYTKDSMELCVYEGEGYDFDDPDDYWLYHSGGYLEVSLDSIKRKNPLDLGSPNVCDLLPMKDWAALGADGMVEVLGRIIAEARTAYEQR